MSDKPNITAAKGFFATQRCGDLDDTFCDYVHTDFRFMVSCTCNDELRAAIPWADCEHRGREGYHRLTMLLFSEYELLEYEIRRFTDASRQFFIYFPSQRVLLPAMTQS
ncbi:hypothetical protein [Shinella sp. BYT-45]|uniref:hypothetical protein n=1 Tax=Shinella sp. BYT-45 TaxID=3377377 RepID=UPI00397F9B96